MSEDASATMSAQQKTVYADIDVERDVAAQRRYAMSATWRAILCAPAHCFEHARAQRGVATPPMAMPCRRVAFAAIFDDERAARRWFTLNSARLMRFDYARAYAPFATRADADDRR
jgi:hypothetical protein